MHGGTVQRSAAGKISYASYARIVEYAGLRDNMVILMGEEIVRPKGEGDAPTGEVHRRFTDLRKQVGGSCQLTAWQATIISRP